MKTLKINILIAVLFCLNFQSFAQSVNTKPVLEHYYLVKDALVKSDAHLASQEAKKMLVAVKEFGAGQEGIKQLLLNLETNLKHITDNKELRLQRDYFLKLSEDMKILLSKKGTTGQVVYEQHCPMAFQNKGGSWLSSQKEIRNPYYGDKMLKCGTVKETLK